MSAIFTLADEPEPATHWFYQAGDVWRAVAGETEQDWFADCDRARLWTPRPRMYPIAETPPFGTLVYADADGGEHRRRAVLHPAACPYCGGHDVNSVDLLEQLRPAVLNDDGSYTVGEVVDVNDGPGPVLLFCHGCASTYPLPDGVREEFHETLKDDVSAEVPTKGEPGYIGADVRWTATVVPPPPTRTLLRDITASDLAMDLAMDSAEPGEGYPADYVIGPAGTTVRMTGVEDGDMIQVCNFAADPYAGGFVHRSDLGPVPAPQPKEST